MEETKNQEINQEELKKITGVYKELNPINRYFIASASGMLLASQNAEKQEKEVV